MELFVSHLGMSPLEADFLRHQGGAFRGRPDGIGALERVAGPTCWWWTAIRWPTIRILQDRKRIRALFKAVKRSDLAEPRPSMRWPWEKSLEISHGSFATTPSTAGGASEEKDRWLGHH